MAASVAKGLDSKGTDLINKYSLSKASAKLETKCSDEKNSSNKYSLVNSGKKI